MNRAKNQVDTLRRATGRATYVRGHALVGSEGYPYDADGNRIWGWAGPARCSCGAASEDLDSNAARKAWHRRHKLEVLGEGEGR
jgi:hypothetical protein